MKLVLFQNDGKGEINPGLLTDRGVVSIASAVKRDYTPQLTMQGIIDDFDKLRPTLEKMAKDSPAVALDKVRLRAPLPRPGKFLCCIANYSSVHISCLTYLWTSDYFVSIGWQRNYIARTIIR